VNVEGQTVCVIGHSLPISQLEGPGSTQVQSLLDSWWQRCTSKYCLTVAIPPLLAPYFCIRGWAVGLSEAVVPQRQLPPHHKDKKWEHCQLGLMKCLVRPNKDGVATHCDLVFPVKW
jgi:hypothetical protein